MWNRASLKNDRFFLDLVNSGYLKVFKSGKIINTITGNCLGFKPLARAGGYHRVSVRRNGKTKNIGVHRLIWLVFKGLIRKGLQVNHEDGNKSNNCLSNLNLSTNAQNTEHSYRVLGLGDKSGSKHTLAAFDDATVRKVIRMYGTGKYSQRELAVEFDVSQKTILNIVNGKTYIGASAT